MNYPYEGKPGWPHTNRGVHMHPSPYLAAYMRDSQKRAEMLERLKRMHLSWVVVLNAGDSALEKADGKPVVEHFMGQGIVPIVRDMTTLLPRSFHGEGVVRCLVDIYRGYGLRPTVIAWNEPGDTREWVGGKVPKQWRETFLTLWIDAARKIINAGGNAGFPDPLFDWPWFFENLARLAPDLVEEFRQGRAVFTAHLYGKARPPDYPEDDVSRYGTPLIPEGFRAELNDVADLPPWNQLNLERINAARKRLADPNKTWRDDTTCFGAWRNIYDAAEKAWGFRPVMAMTEGGWVPNDPAGSGPDSDERYVPSTPKHVARWTLQIMQDSRHEMYALCPWIYDGLHTWWDNGWVGSHFASVVDGETGQKYGYEKPVVRYLAENPPSLTTLQPRDLLLQSKQLIEEAIGSL